jgi:hypothetical protein
MAALKEHVKLFIVQQLACFNTPTEVAAAVKEEFGIELDRGRIGAYNPTTHNGRELGAKLKDFFNEQRKKFLEDYSSIPITQKSYRMMVLNKQLQIAMERKNTVLVLDILEQAAKEEAGFYSGKQGAGAPNDSPLAEWLKQIGGTSIPIAHDIEGESRRVPESAVQDAEIVEDAKPAKQDQPKPKKLKRIVGRD